MAFAAKSTASSAKSSDQEQALARSQELRSRFSKEELQEVDQVAAKVLKGTLKSKSFFREKDLARKVLERCQKDMPQELVERDKFSKLIDDVVSKIPFITIGDTGYVTMEEVAVREREMIRLAGEHTDEHVLNKTLVEMSIRDKRGISAEQIKAVEAACLSTRRVTVIEGTAGAGKSFTMQAIKEAYRQSGYAVIGTALGWSPAKVLEEATGLDNCVALQGLVNDMKRSRAAATEYFRKPTLMILDEAGMVGTLLMKELLEETGHSKYPIKVVLTGDSLQLNPVDAGNALEVIVHVHGTTRIDTIRRQVQASHRLAVKQFSQRRAGAALNMFAQQEAIRWCQDEDTRYDMIVRDYLSYRHAFPDKKALILAYTNKEVQEINTRVRKIYKKLGLVNGRELELQVTDGRMSWDASFAVGDEVQVRANSKELQVYKIPSGSNLIVDSFEPIRAGVFNRNTAKVAALVRSKNPVGSFDVHLDLLGERPGRVVLNSQTFKAQEGYGFPVVHNFATTVYASQGQTVNKVFVVDHPRIDFRLAYVGMSRHTDSVAVYLNETELHQRMDKMRGIARPMAVKLAERDGKPMDVIPVTLGRYRRSEMLQTVALHWAKDSVNLTMTMLDIKTRLGMPQKKIMPSDEDLATLKPESSEDPLVDFEPPSRDIAAGDTLSLLAEREQIDAEVLDYWKSNVRQWNNLPADAEALPEGRLFLGDRINVPVALIDVETLLKLEDPITETAMVKPSVVEANNKDMSWTSMPLATETPEPPVKLREHEKDPFTESVQQNDGGFLSKTWRMFTGKTAKTEKSELDVSESKAVKGSPTVGKVESLIQTVAEALHLRPVITNIPMLPATPALAVIDEKGLLRFASEQQGASPAMIEATKDIWWGVGRGGEPRMFARDQAASIVSRYNLEGQCLVGEGYPPMLINTKGGGDAPIMIVPGAKEWLWSHEHNQGRMAKPDVDPKTVPHIVWGAKDVDWRWIAKAMRTKKVTIGRSKTDDAQIPWAVALQNELWALGVTADIRPRPPGLTAPWEPAEAAVITPASPPVEPVAPVASPSPAVPMEATVVVEQKQTVAAIVPAAEPVVPSYSSSYAPPANTVVRAKTFKPR